LADFVIFDSAAGLGGEAVAAIVSSSEVILVTNPEIPAVTDALKASKLAEQLKKEVKGVIVTRVKGSKTEMPIQNVKDMLELPILGIVPEDERVPISVVKKDALMHTHPRCGAAKAYRKIAAKLIGKERYREPGFFARLFGASSYR
jgi:septum site-determining protein MinD